MTITYKAKQAEHRYQRLPEQILKAYLENTSQLLDALTC
jgi:hypothetical protein